MHATRLQTVFSRAATFKVVGTPFSNSLSSSPLKVLSPFEAAQSSKTYPLASVGSDSCNSPANLLFGYGPTKASGSNGCTARDTAPFFTSGYKSSQLATSTSFGTLNSRQIRFYSMAVPDHAFNTTEKVTHKWLRDQEDSTDTRTFNYFMLSGERFVTTAGLRNTAMVFLSTWSPSAAVVALATLEVNLAGIAEGKTVTVKWRGKPVFIKHRSDEEREAVASVPLEELRDPQTDTERFPEGKYAVLLAICTHLGCVPLADAGEFGGFFCPCHGSHYDASGRIRKGPAPRNLEIPTFQFIEDGQTLLIG